MKPVLAADLGGTRLAAALVSADGRIIHREDSLTLAGEGPRAVTDHLFSVLDNLLHRQGLVPSHLAAIGLGVAGIVDLSSGRVVSGPHLPGWHNVPLRDTVAQKYGLPVHLLNDASAAALGEHRYGAGRGARNLVLLTLGTGIGGGIIIDGRLYQGALGTAGEFGHMSIDVGGEEDVCGNLGCLETFVSGPAIAAAVRDRLAAGEKSSRLEAATGQPDGITAEKVGDAARRGDALARDVIRRAGEYLGIGLVNVVNIFNPELVIIGGGLAGLGSLLLVPARRIVRERAFSPAAQKVCIVPARLGNDAGLIGAAACALDALD